MIPTAVLQQQGRTYNIKWCGLCNESNDEAKNESLCSTSDQVSHTYRQLWVYTSPAATTYKQIIQTLESALTATVPRCSVKDKRCCRKDFTYTKTKQKKTKTTSGTLKKCEVYPHIQTGASPKKETTRNFKLFHHPNCNDEERSTILAIIRFIRVFLAPSRLM